MLPESAPCNFGDNNLEYILQYDGSTASIYMSLENCVQDFIDFDDGTFEILVYRRDALLPVLEAETDSIANFIRAKKVWGYDVTYIKVIDYFGISDSSSAVSASASGQYKSP